MNKRRRGSAARGLCDGIEDDEQDARETSMITDQPFGRGYVAFVVRDTT
jgi:hypothetical protein